MTTGLERELHDFWCAYEATIGFRSTFSAMLAAHAGVSMGSGPPVGWDPYAEIIDRLSEGSRTYRALRRMQTADVVVLYRLFGPRNARSEHAQLGELSPLAVLTEAVQEARDEIVLDESTRRSDTTGARVEADKKRRRPELEAMFWREVGVIARAADAFGRTRKVDRQDALEQRVNAGWTLLGQLLTAYEADGAIRARVGAIEATDREVTSEAAVRLRLQATNGKEAEAKRRAFVAAVQAEATGMRTRALTAYRIARKAERESRELLAGAA